MFAGRVRGGGPRGEGTGARRIARGQKRGRDGRITEPPRGIEARREPEGDVDRPERDPGPQPRDLPKRLPAGTRIRVSGAFDNSPWNPFNPNPAASVGFGEQTDDEMFIGYLNYSEH